MILADDPGTLASPVVWANYGILGLLVTGAIAGLIYFKPSVADIKNERDRLLGERDRANAQRDAMAEVLQERLLPVVSEFITTTKALLPILQEVQRLQYMVPALQEFIDKAGEGGGSGGRTRA